MSKKADTPAHPKRDSLGRRHRPAQTKAIVDAAKRRALPDDMTTFAPRAIADADAMSWFRALSTRERGEIIEAAHRHHLEGSSDE